MVMNHVLRGPIGKRRDICVIAIDKYSRLLFLDDGRQQLGWPKDFRLLGRPRALRVAI